MSETLCLVLNHGVTLIYLGAWDKNNNNLKVKQSKILQKSSDPYLLLNVAV
jgi:hypothetical protein